MRPVPVSEGSLSLDELSDREAHPVSARAFRNIVGQFRTFVPFMRFLSVPLAAEHGISPTERLLVSCSRLINQMKTHAIMVQRFFFLL